MTNSHHHLLVPCPFYPSFGMAHDLYTRLAVSSIAFELRGVDLAFFHTGEKFDFFCVKKVL
jgi:hypothetical protein